MFPYSQANYDMYLKSEGCDLGVDELGKVQCCKALATPQRKIGKITNDRTQASVSCSYAGN